MPRRPQKDMERIANEISQRIQAEHKRDIIIFSARALSREFGVAPATVTEILRDLGAKTDGYVWYFEKVGE